MHPAPTPMHIPDGFLSIPVALAFWLLSAVVITLALQKAERFGSEQQLPLMGVLAAAIFAGQMLNFTVIGGTSGHLLGAALAVILLGPWAAVLVMTSVVGLQALVFQDGGLLALGANLFNMAVVGVFVSYAAWQGALMLFGRRSWGSPVAGFTAAWLSIFVTALAAALQLALSGTSPANIALPAMGGVHALIGIGEGLITLGALTFLAAARPDLLGRTGNGQHIDRSVWVGGMLFSIGLVLLAPLASSHPDGLEWVAQQAGFSSLARTPQLKLLPDYLLPGVENQALATILAGLIGILIIAGSALIASRVRHRSQP
mgnify:CR=1 FL=1